jgi:predicted nucleic acid-binding Zn finger protein
MSKLNWDFSDQKKNSKRGLIDRQKSARKLEVNWIDRDKKQGEFFDSQREETVVASLEECECRDFHFVGNARRKKFQPCKHIYRLAAELGLFELKHEDYKSKIARLNNDNVIRSLPRDPKHWGEWHPDVHLNSHQQARQERGYEIVTNNEEIYYQTTLKACSCPDFQERKLPCKHIYALAIKRGLPIPMTKEKWQKNKQRMKESFIPVITIGLKQRRRQK